MANQGAGHHAVLPRVKRIEGQVRGIGKMIEDERYCIDILSQIKAIKSALKGLESKILEEHLNHCVHRAISSKDTKNSKAAIDEILGIIRKSCS